MTQGPLSAPIARCVCTDRSFRDLLAEATRRCLGVEDLAASTGAGAQCRRCLPYLRRALSSGQTEFYQLLPEDPVGGSGEAAAPLPPPLPPPTGPVVMSWSGGKDSAMALHRLRADPRYAVVGLMTTVSHEFRRVSHHGVREELLEQQAAAIGLPLRKVYFPGPDGGPPTMENFDRQIGAALAEVRARGAFLIGHGDIFLQDLRRARERRLATVGMRGVFPLWQEDTGENTAALLRRFTADGFRAVVTCAEPAARQLAGAELGSGLWPDAWPEGVDPCGEHGEYHTFVYDGPIFTRPVGFERGATIQRDGRWYTDLCPLAPSSPSSPPFLQTSENHERPRP